MRSLLMVLAMLLVGAQAALGQDAGGGWLGVDLNNLTKQDADALGWDEPRGAKIEKLHPGGPADKAGLQAGDIITAIDGVELDSASDLREAIGRRAAGAAIRLSMRREGRERRLAVTLGGIPVPLATNTPRPWPQVMLDTGGHMAMINDTVFTPDGRQLVSASDDKTIRIWDVATGKPLRTIRGQAEPGEPGKMFAMALSPNGKWLVGAGWTAPDCNKGCGDIRLFDFATGRLVALLKGHSDVVLALAFSPDGRRLISGSADDTAIIWDVEQRRVLQQLKGHTASIYAVGFTPDGARAVTGSYDRDLRLWSVADGQPIGDPMTGHGDKIYALAVAPDGTIASGDESGEIRLWDGKTGAFRKTPPGIIDGDYSAILVKNGDVSRKGVNRRAQQRPGIAVWRGEDRRLPVCRRCRTPRHALLVVFRFCFVGHLMPRRGLALKLLEEDCHTNRARPNSSRLPALSRALKLAA